MAKTPAEIRSLARKHTSKAVETLAKIMNSPKCADSARVSAANSLLDRGWGKPEQYIDVTNRTIREISDAELIAIATGGSERADPPSPNKSEFH